MLSARAAGLQHVVQLVGQFRRQCREIIDEIERVLDLVRDAGGELAERGEFLGLHQAVLRGAQFVERCDSSLVRACTSSNSRDILDRDHRLVGEGLQQLDVMVGERAGLDRASLRSPRSTFRHASEARTACCGSRAARAMSRIAAISASVSRTRKISPLARSLRPSGKLGSGRGNMAFKTRIGCRVGWRERLQVQHAVDEAGTPWSTSASTSRFDAPRWPRTPAARPTANWR